MFPARSDLAIQFAHVAYRFEERFRARGGGIAHFTTRTPEETAARLGEADILVVSGFWRNEWLEAAARLRFVQVCAAGYDRFDTEAFRARGVRLANGQGVNTNAVAEHAMALVLALSRQVHLARDAQRAGVWRGMNPDIATREDELAGKTMLVVGAGRIGARLARLARAFGMRVEGMRRNPAAADPAFDAVHAMDLWPGPLAAADHVVLCCPLTPETAGLVDAAALAAMRPDACLVNVARGGCAVEADLVAALEAGRIAAAGIDVTDPEPLPESSRLWSLDNVLLTPHTAGETRRYEDNVLDILTENIARLERGETELRNGIA